MFCLSVFCLSVLSVFCTHNMPMLHIVCVLLATPSPPYLSPVVLAYPSLPIAPSTPPVLQFIFPTTFSSCYFFIDHILSSPPLRVTCRQVASGTTARQGRVGGRRPRPPVPTSTTDARPDPAATQMSASPRHQRLYPRHQRLWPRHHSLLPTSVCRCPHTVLFPIRCLTVTSSCPATVRMTWLT